MEEHQLDPFDALDLVKAEDGRFLGGGDVRIGNFILLVDSDTRIPVDCILPTVSELLQSPEVGFTQHLIAPMQVHPCFVWCPQPPDPHPCKVDRLSCLRLARRSQSRTQDM